MSLFLPNSPEKPPWPAPPALSSYTKDSPLSGVTHDALSCRRGNGKFWSQQYITGSRRKHYHEHSFVQWMDAWACKGFTRLHPPVRCRTPPRRRSRAPRPRWRSCWRWRRSGTGPEPRGWTAPCNTWPDYTPGSHASAHPRLPTLNLTAAFKKQ